MAAPRPRAHVLRRRTRPALGHPARAPVAPSSTRPSRRPRRTIRAAARTGQHPPAAPARRRTRMNLPSSRRALASVRPAGTREPIATAGTAPRGSRRGLAAVTIAAAVFAASPAIVRAAVNPSSGGPGAAFTITFPAQAVAFDLQLTGPGRCATLDLLYISIERARHGRFRFGPRVRGARPRRNGRRLHRWCRGAYDASVIASAEFDPMDAQVVSSGKFTVR